MSKSFKLVQYVDYLIVGFIFLILFALPVLFTRVNGHISWIHVVKIWKDQTLLIPIFALNHWLLAPKLMLRQKYVSYLIILTLTIAAATIFYYLIDVAWNPNALAHSLINSGRPTPIPPYAHLLMYSLLIVGVDTGLLFLKKWNENEEKQYMLEKENSEMQLEILRNQVSPHFLMNTLNNIYALIDLDSFKAREAVMKLSKLMRYMLYENGNAKVLISKEFEFVRSYIDLMKLRFENDMIIELKLPEQYDDFEIPPLLFISFIENAFKHGASNQKFSKIIVSFSFDNNFLVFNCFNKKNVVKSISENKGVGIENSISRLNMLYGENHSISINSAVNYYDVTLKIPIL